MYCSPAFTPMKLLPRVQGLPSHVPPPPRVVPQAPFPRLAKTSINYQQQSHPAWYCNHIFDNNGQKQSIDQLLAGPNAATWMKSTGNKLGQLSEGIPD
eukprot:15338712-Ditylum_brightwellii.AAC.1